MKRLEGQAALVTGASSGFGRAIAQAFAAEGAAVALVARRIERLDEVAEGIREQGGTAVTCPADIAVEAEVREALGPIDLLVNNAGTNIAARSVSETSSEAWRRLLEVNLTSAFLFTKEFLPAMIAREQGTVINIASRAATHPSLLGGVAYSTSKRGMEALTAVTNEEGNPHHVRACVINPGEGDTEIMDLRPAPPSAARRAAMIQPSDLAALVVLIAAMPQRVAIEAVELRPTRR